MAARRRFPHFELEEGKYLNLLSSPPLLLNTPSPSPDFPADNEKDERWLKKGIFIFRFWLNAPLPPQHLVISRKFVCFI